jgi:hypothetical protein
MSKRKYLPHAFVVLGHDRGSILALETTRKLRIPPEAEVSIYRGKSFTQHLFNLKDVGDVAAYCGVPAFQPSALRGRPGLGLEQTRCGPQVGPWHVGEVTSRLRYFRSPWVSGHYNFSAALLPLARSGTTAANKQTVEVDAGSSY